MSEPRFLLPERPVVRLSRAPNSYRPSIEIHWREAGRKTIQIRRPPPELGAEFSGLNLAAAHPSGRPGCAARLALPGAAKTVSPPWRESQAA